MASGVIYYDKDGVEQFQGAEVVIIACNGIGTPRLLLNSASGRFPNGLANSSGLVGKNLMFHPYAQAYGYVEEPTDSNRAPPTCLWSKEFYETDASRGFVRGYAIQFVFQRGDDRVIGALVRPRLAERRHLAGAQLAHDLFPDFCVFADAGQVQPLQAQRAGLEPGVVTGDAKLVEEFPLRGHGRFCVGCG